MAVDAQRDMAFGKADEREQKERQPANSRDNSRRLVNGFDYLGGGAVVGVADVQC
jgi:hypothetical protein